MKLYFCTVLENLLKNISNPSDVRKLHLSQLPILAKELREFIIDIIATKEGHLGASLGVIELTIALHYLFDTPSDLLVWDVGHQAYGHKILTGRKDIFYTNRQLGGIAGFPSRKESEFDAFGVGHSSTSISAVLGMAIASAIKGNLEKQHIAVIGDASIASGMAFEALNHAGVSDANILIILNDNAIGIDPSVGALKEYLTKVKTDKKLAAQNNIIKALNFDYSGPIDGHDISIIDLQNELAHEYTGIMLKENAKNDLKKSFGRLIWLSPDIKNITERQKIFIENIKTEAALYNETEVLEIDLEEMKSIIIEEIESGGRFNTKHREINGYVAPSREDLSKIIYLIYDRDDKEESQKILKLLQKAHFRVVQPIFEGELMDVRYIHQENLKRCDGVIIYYGKTSDAWIKTKLQDVRKAPGFGRSKPLRAKAVYLEGEKTIDLAFILNQKTMILGNKGPFKSVYLDSFLALFKK